MNNNKNISIYERSDDSLITVISIENNKLKYIFYKTDKDLQDYLESNKIEWESKMFTLYLPNVSDEGKWTGEVKKGFKIGDDMYLDGLYLYLNDNVKKQIFNMKYIFHI